MGFDFICLGGEENEEEYINKFKTFYQNDIITPEGLVVCFNLSNPADITHIWRGGKQGKFNKGRAMRIQWIQEILTKQEKRAIKSISKNKIIFLSHKIGKNTYYATVCVYAPKATKYRLITAYLLTSQQVKKYLRFPNFSN